MRAAAAAPEIWHQVRTMIAEFLGKPIDLLDVNDLVGCDRVAACAELERLGPDARIRLRVKLDEILRAEFIAVREARAAKEAAATLVDVLQSVRMQGKLEGMREAIAAGAAVSASAASSPAAHDSLGQLGE